MALQHPTLHRTGPFCFHTVCPKERQYLSVSEKKEFKHHGLQSYFHRKLADGRSERQVFKRLGSMISSNNGLFKKTCRRSNCSRYHLPSSGARKKILKLFYSSFVELKVCRLDLTEVSLLSDIIVESFSTSDRVRDFRALPFSLSQLLQLIWSESYSFLEVKFLHLEHS